MFRYFLRFNPLPKLYFQHNLRKRCDVMSNKYLLNDKQQFINSVGTELAWGWSPAVDFAEVLGYIKVKAISNGGDDAQSDPDNSAATAGAASQGANSTPITTAAATMSTGGNEDDDIDAMIAQIQRLSTGTKVKDDDNNPNDIRVFLCGACDIRHIFRTLASLRVNEVSSLEDSREMTWHFYIYEPNLRIHARHLFFLKWLLDSTFSLDELEERVLTFLDIYGNALVRDTTAAQVRSVAQQISCALRSEEKCDLTSLVSFAEMKQKEIDFVEQQIVHWTRDKSIAHVEETRARRVRQEMAERFDNRDNIIDWDFQFHLVDYTNLIKLVEYRAWRNSGVAFDVAHINPRRGFTYTYSVPNKTLCHFNTKGDGVFLGDIKNGPFFALGAQTANTHIRARTFDGTCKYGNGVVSMHNVRSWLYGLMTGVSWPWSDHAFAWDDAANYNWLPEGTPNNVTHQATFPKVKFHFIGLDLERFFKRMQERKSSPFDMAFIGSGCTQFMTPTFFSTVMAKNSVVVAETAKFVVDIMDEGKEMFLEKIAELAAAAGWERNEEITKALHKDQPDPPKATSSSANSKAGKLAAKRYDMPHQIALTRSNSVC
uniref:DUF4470 domain-containing protein n=1 Tax=Trypanosoma congolense (strain IL3000) TaxID=1068625 RepID=G0UZB4_TRYCI|nr:conserved hypothetical protein [Trypanosoma congolense IL3000]